jgi:hypothetical protein
MKNYFIKNNNKTAERGFVLIIVLVMLVVLSSLGYIITTRVSAEKRRNNYIINYTKAKYACDSAVKYALATLEDINSPELIERVNVPDFSDLFALSEEQYQDFLKQWASEMSKQQFKETVDKDSSKYKPDTSDINDVNNTEAENSLDFDEPKNISSANEPNEVIDYNDPNLLEVPGPYGPEWPLITEPVEFEIGDSKVTIKIEDENAKYPIGWALLERDSKGNRIEREAAAGFETFCEWMDVNELDIEDVREQLEKIEEIKEFSMKFKEVEIKKSKVESTSRSSQPKGLDSSEDKPREERSARAALKRLRERRKRQQQRKKANKNEDLGKVTETMHLADFGRIFNSPVVDTGILTKPTVISEERQESAMKYLGMWATRKVNINTAPRHILEAAFNFGGDYVQIADKIILQRRIEPFKDIADLRERLFRYSDSIKKCEDFITTKSDFFTIRVKADNGTATAQTILAVRLNDGKLEKIAAVSD